MMDKETAVIHGMVEAAERLGNRASVMVSHIVRRPVGGKGRPMDYDHVLDMGELRVKDWSGHMVEGILEWIDEQPTEEGERYELSVLLETDERHGPDLTVLTVLTGSVQFNHETC